MATITLSNPYYYQNEIGGVSSMIGWDGIYYRIARYQFTSPNNGATSINFNFQNFQNRAGTGIQDCNLCFYIGLRNNTHAGANSTSPYTGKITVTQNSSYLYDFSGSASVTLLPSKTYYFWIFSNSEASGLHFADFYDNTNTKTITTSGSYNGGYVYIANSSGGWDKYIPCIGNGTDWQPYSPYIGNGSSWVLYK